MERYFFLQRNRGFTLVELLVVIAILALLIGLLVPSLNNAMKTSRVSNSLSQIRGLERAHMAYAESNKGFLADARLPHGGGDQGAEESFVTTLAPYFEQTAAIKSPLDQSAYWSVNDGGQGVPVPGSTNRFRKTSYGINNHLAREFSAWGAVDSSRITDRISRIKNPAATVHTVCMVETGDFAAARCPTCASIPAPTIRMWRNGATVLARSPLPPRNCKSTPLVARPTAVKAFPLTASP